MKKIFSLCICLGLLTCLTGCSNPFDMFVSVEKSKVISNKNLYCTYMDDETKISKIYNLVFNENGDDVIRVSYEEFGTENLDSYKDEIDICEKLNKEDGITCNINLSSSSVSKNVRISYDLIDSSLNSDIKKLNLKDYRNKYYETVKKELETDGYSCN